MSGDGGVMAGAKTSEFSHAYLSVKVGVIVGAATVGLFAVGVPGTLILAFALAFSGGLWCYLWRELHISIRGNPLLFGVHVFATALAAFLGAFFESNLVVGA